jgi:hypothetical protein
MILAKLVGLSLFVLSSTGSYMGTVPDPHMSAAQKRAIVKSSVTRATECVARAVAADERFARLPDPSDLGDLIVEAVPPCAGLMRAMIESYDDCFGSGTGEAFFSGPYLDTLPAAIAKLVRTSRP